jgi:hypothetical protein
MEENYQQCNFLYSDVMEASMPYNPLSLQIRHKIKYWKLMAASIGMAVVNPLKKSETPVSMVLPKPEVLDLQPGEWVQVRSIEEISATLDESRKYKGLYFMPEMEKFCGKKFKVFKKVEIIKLESTGELRKLRSPSVFLEGVYCNGERHDGCDRSCFHFWREVWLKRVNEV